MKPIVININGEAIASLDYLLVGSLPHKGDEIEIEYTDYIVTKVRWSFPLREIQIFVVEKAIDDHILKKAKEALVGGGLEEEWAGYCIIALQNAGILPKEENHGG